MSRHKRIIAQRMNHLKGPAADEEDSSDEEDRASPITLSKSAFANLLASASSEEEEDEDGATEPHNAVQPSLEVSRGPKAEDGPADDGGRVEGDGKKGGGKAKKKAKSKKKKKGGVGGGGGGASAAGAGAAGASSGGRGSDRALVGRDVEVVGTSRADLNGLRGRVLDFVVASGRYTVRP